MKSSSVQKARKVLFNLDLENNQTIPTRGFTETSSLGNMSSVGRETERGLQGGGF